MEKGKTFTLIALVIILCLGTAIITATITGNVVTSNLRTSATAPKDGGGLVGITPTPAITKDYCTDTDGLNYYNTGYVYGLMNGAYFNKSDYCVNANLLSEMYCNGVAPAPTQKTCPCLNGKCLTNQTTNITVTIQWTALPNGYLAYVTATDYQYGMQSLHVGLQFENITPIQSTIKNCQGAYVCDVNIFLEQGPGNYHLSGNAYSTSGATKLFDEYKYFQGNQTNTTVTCGSIITTSTILTEDLYCPGSSSALIIDANNVILDCNGHKILGNNAAGATGVYVNQKNNVKIQNCEINNFEKGIAFVNSDYGISLGNELNANVYGILVTTDSDYADIINNTIQGGQGGDNTGVLISNDCDNTEITGNHITAHIIDGIRFWGYSTSLNNNIVCQSGQKDIKNVQGSYSGDNNKCDTTLDYNDAGTTGCTYSCTTPDGCTDTDGGVNFYTYGSIYGATNGVPFNYNDSCMNPGMAKETSCVGNLPGFTQFACNCQGGVCINATPNTCYDTDGGINFYVSGITSGMYNGQTYSYSDLCLNSVTLTERYCNGTISQNAYSSCAYGCSSGKCNNQTNSTQKANLTLTANPAGGGTVTGSDVNFIVPTVKTIIATPSAGYTFSYWQKTSGTCTITYPTSFNTTVYIPTSTNCNITAYFDQTNMTANLVVTASPNYGGNVTGIAYNFIVPATKSIMAIPNSGYSFANWVVLSGTCTVQNTLAPNTTVYIPATTNCTVVGYFTDSTIENGCHDTDGGINKFTYGMTGGHYNGQSYSYYDVCLSSTLLNENWCYEGLAKTYNITCTNGCSSGKCIPPNGTNTTTCIDSDGGPNNYLKGYVYGLQYGQTYNYSDFCINSSSLTEQRCSGNTPAFSMPDCPNGCLNGACVHAINTLVEWHNLPAGYIVNITANSNYGMDSLVGILQGPQGTINGSKYCGGSSSCYLQITAQQGEGEYYLQGVAQSLNGETKTFEGYNYLNATTQNSCNDTDGGIVPGAQGTASGWYNNNYYSNLDYCINQFVVQEYYCGGTIAYSTPINCTTGGCLNGACT